MLSLRVRRRGGQLPRAVRVLDGDVAADAEIAVPDALREAYAICSNGTRGKREG